MCWESTFSPRVLIIQDRLIGLVIATGLAGSALATVATSFAADRIAASAFLVALSRTKCPRRDCFGVETRRPPACHHRFCRHVKWHGHGSFRRKCSRPGGRSWTGSGCQRMWRLAWYNVLLDAGGSLGALSAGLPQPFKPLISLRPRVLSTRVLCIFRTVCSRGGALLISLASR